MESSFRKRPLNFFTKWLLQYPVALLTRVRIKNCLQLPLILETASRKSYNEHLITTYNFHYLQVRRIAFPSSPIVDPQLLDPLKYTAQCNFKQPFFKTVIKRSHWRDVEDCLPHKSASYNVFVPLKCKCIDKTYHTIISCDPITSTRLP